MLQCLCQAYYSLCLDQSAFKGVAGVSSPSNFRVYSSFATFVYSQLQTILPDSFLGDVSDWDRFLSINLSSPDLPLKTAAEILQNKDFARLITESNLPTPTHFAEQVLCFHKSFCELLLKHELCKSKLVRGFSVFDEAVLRYGEEVDYTHESEILCDYFIRQKWITSVTKPLILSEYRSFVEKFRSHEVSYEGDWVTFLANYYELHCRENLFTIFKLCCLSSSGVIVSPPNFILSVPELASDVNDFNSSVRCVQSSLVGIPNASELFTNPRTVSSVFSLLGREHVLFEDEHLSVWDVTSSCSSRRRRLVNQLDSRYTCTVTDEEKLWVSLQASPKSSSSNVVRTPPKFATPTPIQVGPGPSGSAGRNPDKSPNLARPVVSMSRVVTDVSFLPDVRPSSPKKLAVKKKSSGDK